MKVSKFGGTSLASAAQMKKVVQIVLADLERKVVVVSAPGKRFASDQKVTDLLITCAEEKLRTGKIETDSLLAILQRYEEITTGLELPPTLLDELESRLRHRLAQPIVEKAPWIDGVKATGEEASSLILAALLRKQGQDATAIDPKEAGMLLTSEYGQARVLPEAYERLSSLCEREGILVFPGFYGFTSEGNLVTFPRGGSDITGSILAKAVGAQLYENFTDVDAVYSVSPAYVANPKPISVLTYQEMRELSYAGFSVFNDEALQPAFQAKIPVCIKNTNNPSAPGTMVVFEREAKPSTIAGIACDHPFCSILVSKYLLHREIGFGRRLLEIIEDEGISYEHSPSGIDQISVILRQDSLSAEKEVRIRQRIEEELQVDHIEVVHDLSMIMVVGEGMRSYPGIAAKATNALAQAEVNIVMINQGSSEVSMMFGIKQCDEHRAISSLYQAFFEENN